MPKNDDTDMSELERQFELEMEDEPTEGRASADEREIARELERMMEAEETPEEEFEEGDEDVPSYAERFYELSLRRFESESEVDDAVNGLLNEIERDFFFKKLWKKIKKSGKSLLKKGMKMAKGLPVFRAVKGITQLARGDLKGLLGSLAKAGLGAAMSAVPGGAAILPALRGLGFETAEEPEANRQAWNNYVAVAREAYDHLAGSLNENADDPAEASRLATEAFRAGLREVQTKVATRGGRRYRVVEVARGEKIIIKGV